MFVDLTDLKTKMHRSTKNCIWLKCRNDGVSVSAGDSAVRWPVAVAVVGGRGCVGRCSLLLRCPMCLVPSRLQLRRAGGPPRSAPCLARGRGGAVVDESGERQS